MTTRTSIPTVTSSHVCNTVIDKLKIIYIAEWCTNRTLGSASCLSELLVEKRKKIRRIGHRIVQRRKFAQKNFQTLLYKVFKF